MKTLVTEDELIEIMERGIVDARESMRGASMVWRESVGVRRNWPKFGLTALARAKQYRDIALKLERRRMAMLREQMGF